MLAFATALLRFLTALVEVIARHGDNWPWWLISIKSLLDRNFG